MKITEIKVVAGKDVFIFQPKSITVVVGGKSWEADEKQAAALWKVVAPPCEKMCSELPKAMKR